MGEGGKMLPEACQGKRRKKTIIQWLVVGILFVILLAMGSLILLYLEKTGKLETFFNWISSIGYWGNFVLIFVMIIMNFPFAFGWMIVAMLCGFLYGFVEGLVTVIIATVIGSFLAFIFLRYFLRKPAINYIEKKGGYVARATIYELQYHQIKVSLMVRAGPIPPGLQNAILALSPMSTWLYVVTSFFGFLIKEIPYVYIGTGVKDLTDVIAGGESSATWVDLVLFLIGTLGVVAMFVFIIWVSRKAMKDAKELQRREMAMKETIQEDVTPAGDTSEEEADDAVQVLLSRPLTSDPFNYSDPVLEFFGLVYGNDNEDDSSDLEQPLRDPELEDTRGYHTDGDVLRMPKQSRKRSGSVSTSFAQSFKDRFSFL